MRVSPGVRSDTSREETVTDATACMDAPMAGPNTLKPVRER